MHVSGRNEGFQAKLRSLGKMETSDQYSNFQNNLRDFIKYANRLHDQGLADIVLATGDLVDYVFEKGDNPGGGGNFALLEKTLRGIGDGEELRIPIYTVFGNHDYRIHPYELKATIDIPVKDDLEVTEYPSHNLTPDEAVALQGGATPKLSPEQALRMTEVDSSIATPSKYDYYHHRFNDKRNYALKLGPHRVVMIDTGSDLGVPAGTDLGDMLTLIWKSTFDSFTETEKQAMTGSPSLGGVGGGIGLVGEAISDPEAGLVIVGMHAPPFSPPGGEYPYYLRETQHPVADARQVPEFLRRRKGDARGWVAAGTAHFKTGLVAQGLDYGIATGRADDFARLIAGGTGRRPADLVLCGHQHDRVEYRLGWDRSKSEVMFFTDFYTENPRQYYHTINNFKAGDLEAGEPLRVVVAQGAAAQGVFTIVNDHRDGMDTRVATMRVPPYAQPLNSTTDWNKWWNSHRPLVLQTGAFGAYGPPSAIRLDVEGVPL
jgi:hypothetical protein